MIKQAFCIESCTGREILDSRGNPTLQATVTLYDGTDASAAVPSGASTGTFEAHEKRDGNRERYGGRGVAECARAIQSVLSPALAGMDVRDSPAVDARLRELDGTADKSALGANVLLAVSLAVARTAAKALGIPLYRYLGGVNARRLPIPMMNVLNGGAHAANNVEIQEFMLVPVGAPSFGEALRWGSEIYHTLGKVLRKEGLSTGVGDEGGFAPDLASDEEALTLLECAIQTAGYSVERVRIGLDAAASEWADEKKAGCYRLPKRGQVTDTAALLAYWEEMATRFPILSVEDGMGEGDRAGWKELTVCMGGRCMLVGDDLFATNPARLRNGLREGLGNSALVKPNQIGTLTETLDFVRLAMAGGYTPVLSHRSGETEDSFLADLCVALNAPFLKAGAPTRGERTAKYNRLLAIEAELGGGAVYGRLS